MNVKFYKDGENTGKILKMSCARCNFVNFDIFLGSNREFLIIITGRLTLEKCKKECTML